MFYQLSHTGLGEKTALYLLCSAQAPGPQTPTKFLFSLVEKRTWNAFEKQLSLLTFKMTAKGVSEPERGHILRGEDFALRILRDLQANTCCVNAAGPRWFPSCSSSPLRIGDDRSQDSRGDNLQDDLVCTFLHEPHCLGWGVGPCVLCACTSVT